MVRRVARGAGIRRRLGYVARPVARRAWVHALGCARPWASARPTCKKITPRHEGRIPGIPELRTTRR
jgi:hypothetical protein